MKKAHRLAEIDAAVNKFTPVTPDHPFYVDFKDLRGDFQERKVMKILNASLNTEGQYYFDFQANPYGQTMLFLAGMRGSGKTSELAKYAKLLHASDCFFVVTCNVDEELDMDNVQYMDILIFQLEKLLRMAAAHGLNLDQGIVDSMQKWFEDRVQEINHSLRTDGSAEMEVGGESSVAGLFAKMLGLTAKIKTGLSGSRERAETIRTNFKNRFLDFSLKFNTFVEQAAEQMRKQNIAQEILFIVDGLEKTMSADTRRKIILEESNRIRQIRANTIFTLPIELMKEEQRIKNFSEIITFPFIKVKERNGTFVQPALDKLREFITKRVDASLFDATATIDVAITHSGGSPRQLLRIIEHANWYADEISGKITFENMEASIEELGNNIARYLEPEDFGMLKKMKGELAAGHPIGFDSQIQVLLEKEVIFEYNDGTYKCVNPLLERSKLYKHHVS
jgi:hypothetical protein